MRSNILRSEPRCGVLTAWLLAGAALLTSGCGADVTSYREYAMKSLQASCERTFRCCSRRCSTSADTTFNSSIKNAEFALKTGLLTFNAAQAEACLDASTSLYTDCSQYVDTVDTSAVSRACTGILQGALPVGVACSQTNDYCTPNSYCSVDGSLDPPQARCRRMIDLGEACDGGGRCVTGSSCTGSPRVCTTNPLSAMLGESCSAMSPCASDLVCLENATCGLPQEGGKPCSANVQCLSGRCAVDTCTVPMTKPTTVSDMLCGGASGI